MFKYKPFIQPIIYGGTKKKEAITQKTCDEQTHETFNLKEADNYDMENM